MAKSQSARDSRANQGKSLFRFLFAIFVFALPCTASAQPWADAYNAGDYQKAADLLHPLVVQSVTQPESADPDPARLLATMYAQGQGVTQDPIAACSLAQAVNVAANFVAPNRYAANIAAYDASLKEADAFAHKHCDRLTTRERVVASYSLGCFAFGMPEDVLAFGSQAVRVGRGGISFADAADKPPEPLTNCPQLIARVRPLTITPPSDVAPGVAARRFVEVLGWLYGQDPHDSTPVYVLQWELYEVRDKKIDQVASAELDVAHKWPAPALPRDLDARLTLEMIRSGHVHWKLEGAPPKSGWITLPEEQAR
jgi:hypothetical protein